MGKRLAAHGIKNKDPLLCEKARDYLLKAVNQVAVLNSKEKTQLDVLKYAVETHAWLAKVSHSGEHLQKAGEYFQAALEHELNKKQPKEAERLFKLLADIRYEKAGIASRIYQNVSTFLVGANQSEHAVIAGARTL